jgi:hypothetical protein
MMPKIYEETISTKDENEDKLKELYNIYRISL